MMRFTRRAMRNAPAGSPLAGLILQALYERGKSSPLEEPVRALFERRRLKTAVNALALVPEHDPHLLPLRHLLAHHLVRARIATEHGPVTRHCAEGAASHDGPGGNVDGHCRSSVRSTAGERHGTALR
ncbi:hypothetical protein [Kitasatospora sp. NPDC001527]|uniref:hypothetical protein n=1 Tax=Kitasatospora sp. NPDC001527 TaxID=3154519 RepID=UPI00332356FB